MVNIENKTILVIEVFLSGLRPHYIRSKGIENSVYVRLGSTNRLADKELIEEIRRSVQGITYDSLPMSDLKISDLDMEFIKKTFDGIRKIDEKTLYTLRIITKEQRKYVPTIGGILLFRKNRKEFFPDCYIQCGRFIGKDKSRIFDNIDIDEPLSMAVESIQRDNSELHQKIDEPLSMAVESIQRDNSELHQKIDEPLSMAVESIMSFLKKHAIKNAEFTSVRRKDIWSIPIIALREAVINAIVHADYSQKGSPIRIAFYDNRIEIENPGILPQGLTVDDILQGVSKVRNPVIARVFRELNLIEQWGSGIPRIFVETRNLGFPEPKIQELGLKFRIIFYLKEIIITRHKKPESKPESKPELKPESRQKIVSEKIVSLLRKKPMSKSELAEALGQKTISGYLKKVLRQLLNQRIIEYSIPEKPNSRLQKYKIVKR